MSIIRIEIETDNAAFADGGGALEVARILRRLADDYEDFGTMERIARGSTLRDRNGNTVGAAKLVEHCSLEDYNNPQNGSITNLLMTKRGAGSHRRPTNP